jgi:exopolysaccharide biosynthesis protein
MTQAPDTANNKSIVRYFMKLVIILFVSFFVVIGGRISAAAQAVTNCQLPGIVCFSEIRTNPPQRLFVARVDLTNPRLHLRVAPGGPDPDNFSNWETTLMEPTHIADREHFSLVVNGDFFLAKNVQDGEGAHSHYRAGQWARTVGPAMSDGQTWSTSTSARPCLVIHKDRSATIESLTSPGADDWEVVGGGPVLLRNGVVVVPPVKPASPQKRAARNPRTVVGLDSSSTRLTLLIVDGRKPGIANGMTFNELAAEMLQLGCSDAINLDGGGSSVIAVRDTSTGMMKILNRPTDGHERAVADVLGIVLDK